MHGEAAKLTNAPRLPAKAYLAMRLALPAISGPSGRSIYTATHIGKEARVNQRYEFARVRNHTRLGRRAQWLELRHRDCWGKMRG